jgi:hypothetical protein
MEAAVTEVNESTAESETSLAAAPNDESLTKKSNYQFFAPLLSSNLMSIKDLKFICRRKKIPPSSRLFEGSVKKSGKNVEFSRRVYVPPREVVEISACDSFNVWKGDLDYPVHNVTRWEKGGLTRIYVPLPIPCSHYSFTIMRSRLSIIACPPIT